LTTSTATGSPALAAANTVSGVDAVVIARQREDFSVTIERAE
jgi:hypothetical protein